MRRRAHFVRLGTDDVQLASGRSPGTSGVDPVIPLSRASAHRRRRRLQSANEVMATSIDRERAHWIRAAPSRLPPIGRTTDGDTSGTIVHAAAQHTLDDRVAQLAGTRAGLTVLRNVQSSPEGERSASVWFKLGKIVARQRARKRNKLAQVHSFERGEGIVPRGTISTYGPALAALVSVPGYRDVVNPTFSNPASWAAV